MKTKKNSTQLSLVQRRLVNSAVAIQEEDPEQLAFQHTVFCQTGLPYRNPGNDVRKWTRSNGNISLLVKAGEALNPETNSFEEVGLPFGTKPRLILTYLNSEAIRTGEPLIEVDQSLTAFVGRLKLDTGGRTIRSVKDQLTRLSTSDVVLGTVRGDHAIQTRATIVDSFDLWLSKNTNQRVLWPSTVLLSDKYFNSLVTHAVPLDERAVAALSHSAMGLDMYAWLAQRLHRIQPQKPQFIPWAALKEQFGQGYARMDNFKRVFRETVKAVHTQYNAAKIELDGRGMVLKHSPPPIKSRSFSLPGSN